MKFLNFLKKHWKTSAAISVIVIATIVGVVYVKASTVSISVSLSSINFAEGQTSQELTAKVDLSLDNDVSIVGWDWTMVDTEVATVSNNEGSGIVYSKGAGKTSLNVRYSLSDGTNATKTIPVTVPLVVNYDSVSGVLSKNGYGTVTCNAATTKFVEWSSSNSNVVSVTKDGAYPNGSVATINAVSGGKAIITASIPSDSLSYSFTVTVGVSIDQDMIEVEQNTTKTIETNSNSISDVYWWSDNPEIASVSNGVVTGIYAGTTTIYASCREGDITGNAGDMITVTVPYKVTAPSTTVLVGDRLTFATTARPSEVNYASSNNSVISYDSSTGQFIANATGTADISVTWNGDTRTVTVSVIDGISLSTSALYLNVGASGTVTATVTNTEAPVHWSISDPSMATFFVGEDGLTATVTALATGTNKKTTLVATQEINGVVKSYSCDIYVLNPVNSLTLLYNGTEIKETIAIEKGNAIYITAYLNLGESVVPDNTKISWVSSDSSIIAVSPATTEGQQQLCEIKALNGGNATITAVTEDGLYIATADFYVTEGVKSISLDKTDVTAQMALEKYQLKATVLPDSAGVDTSVIWASLDTSILTVDQNGLVTFVGPGETYVSATSNADSTKVAYCHFLITQQVEGIKIDFESVTLNVGEEFRLSALISPDNATNKNVTWSSSNEKVVKVDKTGMLTAVGSGSATIVVQTEDGGYIDMANVTVLQPVTSIVLSNTEMSVKKGTVFYLGATVLPDTANNKKVMWASSDTSLATVDQNGKVTTLAVGTVTISCTSVENGVVAYCIVEITEPVTGLTLNTYYQEMVAGTKFVIVPTVLPLDAPNKNVTFLSSDPSVATVDENGIVTALVGGTCEIVVTTVESNLKATCTIVVKEFVESVKISGNPDLLNVGDSVELSVEVLTQTASNRAVYWTTSNSAIAIVDQNGKVKGVAPGNVVITATAADGSGVSDSVVIRVIEAVTSISLSESKITIYVGETYNLKATINPPNASIKEIEWSSDNEAIAKAYYDGDVVGVSPGRTVVYAKSTDGNDVVARCTVIVKDIVRATSISVNSSEITMLKGKTRKLTARLYPTNSNETVKWVSSDTSIVTVDQYGNIITVGAGHCEVTAYSSAGSVEDTCIIHSLAMSCVDLKLEQYDTFNLFVDGAPSGISWRSSNPRIASVDQNGVVTGRMPGECRITATVEDKTVTCYVKVMAVDPGKFIN